MLFKINLFTFFSYVVLTWCTELAHVMVDMNKPATKWNYFQLVYTLLSFFHWACAVRCFLSTCPQAVINNVDFKTLILSIIAYYSPKRNNLKMFLGRRDVWLLNVFKYTGRWTGMTIWDAFVDNESHVGIAYGNQPCWYMKYTCKLFKKILLETYFYSRYFNAKTYAFVDDDTFE